MSQRNSTLTEPNRDLLNKNRGLQAKLTKIESVLQPLLVDYYLKRLKANRAKYPGDVIMLSWVTKQISLIRTGKSRWGKK